MRRLVLLTSEKFFLKILVVTIDITTNACYTMAVTKKVTTLFDIFLVIKDESTSLPAVK